MSKSLDALIDDLEFIAGEIVRIDQAVKGGGLAAMPKADLFAAGLPRPDGGNALIGHMANDRVWALSARVLKASTYRNRIDVESIDRELRKVLGQLLFAPQRISGGPIDGHVVHKAFASALKAAARDCRDRRHFLAAELMWLPTPEIFSLGPVIFRPSSQLRTAYAESIGVMANRGDTHEARARSMQFAESTLDYFETFDWTAEVNILRCDSTISNERARMAAEAAVDLIRLLASDRHTRRMRVGGFKITDRNQASMTLQGSCLSWSFSRIPQGEAGFDGWGEWLASPDQQAPVAAAGKAMATLCDPDLDHPVSARWLDALNWYGQGVRDASNGAAIVKFVTAIERMVMTGEKDNGQVLSIFKARAAAVVSLVEGTTFEEDQAKAASIYGVRSGLVHGSISTLAPRLVRDRFDAAEFARRVLLIGVMRLDVCGMLEARITDKALGHFYDKLAKSMAGPR